MALSQATLVGGAVIIAILFYLIINFFLNRITKISKKTKTKFDDLIIQQIKKPISFTILLILIQYTSNVLNFTFKYGEFTQSKLFTILWIILITYSGVRIIKTLMNWYGEEISYKTKIKIDDTLFPFIKRLISGIIYLIALLIIFDNLGIKVGPLLASLGIAGLAVALALQDTLSNFFAGIYMTIDKPIKINDFIDLSNEKKGYVQDIGWRSTRIKTLGNNFIIIPNSKLANSILINYKAPQSELSVIVPLGVSYNSDLEKVEKIVTQEATKIQKKIEGAVKDFKPFIRYNEFANNSINFAVILRAKTFVDQYLIKHEFIKAIKKRFDKEKIEIPFPQIDVHMKK